VRERERKRQTESKRERERERERRYFKKIIFHTEGKKTGRIWEWESCLG
jgi:hypothetical protein